MPYARLSELPSGVRARLPRQAQQIYRQAFNHAWEEYADARRRRTGASREETAHRVAWAAVKTVYARGADGRWRRRARPTSRP